MRNFIVTASWTPEGCWECEGTTGQAFVFVRAHDGKEAVEMARERLMPRDYGQPRFVAATALALPVAPQAKKTMRIAEREMHVRAGSYVTVLRPKKEASGE
jgi:hypothetical protein